MAKISIIGAGFVGTSTAFSLLMKGVVSEIAIVDVNKDKAEGEALDLKNGLVFTEHTRITHSDKYDITKNSDIVIITAGANQKPGETRLDLVHKNSIILKDIIKNLLKYEKKDTVYIMVTNPVDVLTFVAKKLIPNSENRVFGTGTSLDTARLRHYLSEKIDVSPRNVHLYVLGEHGDSSFPTWSSAYISVLPLLKHEGITQKVLDTAYTRTRNSAYEIISKKGATYYAIALTVTHICDAILSDSREILAVSTIPTKYGIKDVSLSIPCVIGKEGICQQQLIPLSSAEKKLLEKSQKVLKEYTDMAIKAIKTK
jgi:L-lactate dehydrogenase